MAVEQAARDYGLVVLTSDHDTHKGNVLLDAAATSVEEGFDLAATDNPASTLLQVGGRRRLHSGQCCTRTGGRLFETESGRTLLPVVCLEPISNMYCTVC